MLEASADLGEKVIKSGLALFPNEPFLLIFYANFLMEVGGFDWSPSISAWQFERQV